MSEEVAELERALARVCLASKPDASDLERLGGEAHLVYRRMVRARFLTLFAEALPLTLRALGRPRIAELLSDYLDDTPPRTRFFREVPHAFARWADSRVATLEPAWAIDALRLDAARWEALWHDEPREGAVAEFALERVPVPHPTLRYLTLGHAVHRTPAEGDSTWPEPGPVYVCVHRRPDHVIETRWMDRLGGRMLERWSRGEETAIASVERALAEEGRSADAEVVDRMTTLLSALLESGAIIGSR